MRGRLASAFIGGAIANRRAKYRYQQEGNDQLQEYKFQQQQEELDRLRAQQPQQAIYSQPQPQLQGSSSNPEDIANKLQKFAELYHKGALTDAEFSQVKSKLLMQMQNTLINNGLLRYAIEKKIFSFFVLNQIYFYIRSLRFFVNSL